MFFPLDQLFGTFNIFGSAVVVFDGEGRMIQMNPAGRSLFGFTSEKEIEGLSLASLSRRESRSESACTWRGTATN